MIRVKIRFKPRPRGISTPSSSSGAGGGSHELAHIEDVDAVHAFLREGGMSVPAGVALMSGKASRSPMDQRVTGFGSASVMQALDKGAAKRVLRR